MKKIRLGAGTGFWGNGANGVMQQAKSGEIDYLVCDALAELTLAILSKQMKRDSNRGWVGELTQVLEASLPYIKENNFKLIGNWGGLNPEGAMAEVERVAKEKGIEGLKVAVVTGDSIKDKLPGIEASGADLKDMDKDRSYADIKDKVMFANAYVGAKQVAEALDNGADIVITGRAADSALFVGAMVHEFGWSWDDWDKLAAGTLAGHLSECACQSTGGNFLGNWQDIPSMDNMGYPLIEMQEDGNFIITKPSNTGGLVDIETVSEQMIYETLDPNNYIVPDVIADFTSPKLTMEGENRVLVSGTKGKPRPEKLKCQIGYSDGYASSCVVAYSWPDAYTKGLKLIELVKKDAEKAGIEVLEYREEFLGLNSIFGKGAEIASQEELDETLNEAIVKITAHVKDKADAVKFSRLAVPYSLDGPPANAGSAGFTDRGRELLTYVAPLIDREVIEKDLSISYTDL